MYRVETTRGSFFVKHYLPRGVQRRVRDFALRRKPQRALALGRRILGEGVATPEPLGLYLLGRVLPREALLVNQWLDDAEPFRAHLEGRVPVATDPAGFLEAVRDLARLLGGLHRLRLYHGDLHTNILFAASRGGWRAFLIDLDDLRAGLSRRRRAKNLRELGRSVPGLEALTRAQRWRLLQVYAAAAGVDRPALKRLWRRRGGQVVRFPGGGAGP